VLVSAVSYALYLVGSSQVIHRIGSVRLTGIVVSVASEFVTAHLLLTHPISNLQQPAKIYWIGLALAVFSTVLPIYFTSEGIRRLGSNRLFYRIPGWHRNS